MVRSKLNLGRLDWNICQMYFREAAYRSLVLFVLFVPFCTFRNSTALIWQNVVVIAASNSIQPLYARCDMQERKLHQYGYTRAKPG